MENKKVKNSTWLIAAIASTGLIVALIMYMMGRHALKMPGRAKELNRLLWEQNMACSGGVKTEQCEKAKAALDEFKAKSSGHDSSADGEKTR